jgi:hypothetical protein
MAFENELGGQQAPLGFFDPLGLLSSLMVSMVIKKSSTVSVSSIGTESSSCQ